MEWVVCISIQSVGRQMLASTWPLTPKSKNQQCFFLSQNQQCFKPRLEYRNFTEIIQEFHMIQFNSHRIDRVIPHYKRFLISGEQGWHGEAEEIRILALLFTVLRYNAFTCLPTEGICYDEDHVDEHLTKLLYSSLAKKKVALFLVSLGVRPIMHNFDTKVIQDRSELDLS